MSINRINDLKVNGQAAAAIWEGLPEVSSVYGRNNSPTLAIDRFCADVDEMLGSDRGRGMLISLGQEITSRGNQGANAISAAVERADTSEKAARVATNFVRDEVAANDDMSVHDASALGREDSDVITNKENNELGDNVEIEQER